MATKKTTKKAAAKPKKPRSATATEITERSSKKNAPVSPYTQITAVILFAVSVFLLFVVIIRGQNVWAAFHDFLFGLFGICAYIFPFIIGFISILYAKDKSKQHIGFKIFQSVLLLSVLSSAIAIFTRSAESKLGLMDSIVTAYSDGITKKGGGFFGALVGYPFSALFGKVGACIIIVILIFVILMLMSGTTLLKAWKAIYKPVRKTAQKAGDAYTARREEAYRRREEYTQDMNRRFNIDIPLDDDEREREIEEVAKRASAPDRGLDEKSRTVIEAYNSKDDDIIIEKPKTKPKTKLTPESNIDEVISGVTNKALDDKKDETEPFTVPDSAQEPEPDEEYRFPPLSLLEKPSAANGEDMSEELKATATKLVDTLRSFGVETRVINISRGPSVTRYELQPAAGVKINKITNLSDDIALNLATAGVRIEAPIPNKAAVGIEVPNKTSAVVRVREILESAAFRDEKSKLTVCMGRDIAGNAVVTDIAKMPHGLIAGATGSGKSVCINSIIISLLYKADPDEVKLLMIDPKVVELGIYNGIPHLLVPVVTDPRKAAGALGWAVTEMEKRYRLFAESNVRDLNGYNRLAKKGDDEDLIPMPQIVIIIDELADLMMTAPGEVEDSICRIAQKARAAGMHLIIATQRPSVNVITGVIKANIPSRIAFAVSSNVDSRTILDMSGAERLMGRGDMLFAPVGTVKPRRVQGCFVNDDEVEAVVDFVKNGQQIEYDDEVIAEIDRQAVTEKSAKSKDGDSDDDFDPMFNQAAEVVIDAGMASTSLLQRKLKLGYARAARIVDQLESKGIVGPFEGSKPRQVLISKAEFLEMNALSGE